MKYLNEVEHLKFKKKLSYGLPRLKNKRKGSLVYLFTPSIDKSIDLMKGGNPLLIMKYYHSFHYDRLVKVDPMGLKVKKKFNLDKVYNKVNEECDNITNFKLNIKSYKGYNLFKDLSQYMEIFKEKERGNAEKKVHEFSRYLSGIINSKDIIDNDYDKKSIIIPVYDWLPALKKSSTYKINSADNCLLYFINGLLLDTEKMKKYMKDIDIYFMSKNDFFRLNLNELEEEKEIRSIINLLKNKMTNDYRTKKVEKRHRKERDKSPKDIARSIVDDIEDSINDLDNTKVKTEDIELGKKHIKKIEKMAKDGMSKKKIMYELDKDKEFKKDLKRLKAEQISSSKSMGNSKRDEMLRDKQIERVVDDETIGDILKKPNAVPIEKETYNIDTINEYMKENSFSNFNKTYNEKVRKKKIISMVNSFSDKDKPLYVLDVNNEDTSDELNFKETWTVKFEDEERKRHTLKFDLPKQIDDRVLYLNGSKKIMSNQLVLKPITKLKPDTSQICTDYNKIIINRFGSKNDEKSTLLKKSLSNLENPTININGGDASSINNSELTNIQYDEISKTYSSIATKKIEFIFNQPKALDMIKDRDVEVPDNHFILGFYKSSKTPIFVNAETNMVKDKDMDMVDFIVDIINNEEKDFESLFYKQKPGKRFTYGRCNIMNTKVPTSTLIIYCEGIDELIKRLDIKVGFTDKKPRFDKKKKINMKTIKFKDMYMTYDNSELSISMIMNGLDTLPTDSYDYDDFNSKDIFPSIFDTIYGNKLLGNAFDNYYNLMIGPDDVDLLKEYNLPTDFVGCLIHATQLLSDNSYSPEKNMGNVRLRSNELINSITYKTIANQYGRYMNSANKDVGMTVPKDAVIKNIMTTPIIEELPELNPYITAEKFNGVTYKGPSGLNVDQAYTKEKRSFDKTMTGILGISTPFSGNVGINRQLTFDPNIESTNGNLKTVETDEDIEKLPPSKLLTISELLNPFILNHDDSPRTAMYSTQLKHSLPTKRASRQLITTGMDKVFPKISDNSFAYSAKQSGKVKDIDKENGVAILEYKDGTSDVINIGEKIVKNSGGGFHMVNKLEPVVKKGEKFDKNDIIARNPNFFVGDNKNDVSTKSGTLIKVALMGGDFTYEDSTMVSQKLSEDMATDVVKKKTVSLGANSNVDYIVKKGDEVNVNDPLIIFDESYDEESVNKMLSNFDDTEELIKMSKTPIKSPLKGTIQDIKIYHTVDTNDLSKSLKKICDKYDKDKKKVINKIKEHTDNPANFIDHERGETIKPTKGKIKGVEIDKGVVFEFYIKYTDYLGISDKIIMYTALKSTVCDVFEEGKEPYTDHRPEEKIDAILAPISVSGRKVTSIRLQMSVGTCLREGSKQIEEILNS